METLSSRARARALPASPVSMQAEISNPFTERSATSEDDLALFADGYLVSLSR